MRAERPVTSCGWALCLALSVAACGGKQSTTSSLVGSVPGGAFTIMGVESEVAGFGLDRYEVTVARFRPFVEAYTGAPEAGAGKNPNNPKLPGWDAAWSSMLPADRAALESDLQCDALATWSSQPAAGEDRPINCVTWYLAMAFCAWDGGWLPSEIEWQYAASGGSELRLYPWGSAPVDPRRLAVYACQGDGSAAGDCTAEDIPAVGSRPAGAGKWKHEDLAGSLFEWVLDSYAQPTPAPFPADDPCADCAQTQPLRDRAVRGGGFLSEDYTLANAWRDSAEATVPSPATGLRCAHPL